MSSPPAAKTPAAVPVGPSLTAVTSSAKVLEAVSAPSLAVTLSWICPLKSCGGVPEKVPVRALKLSQPGSAAPSPSVAL